MDGNHRYWNRCVYLSDRNCGDSGNAAYYGYDADCVRNDRYDDRNVSCAGNIPKGFPALLDHIGNLVGMGADGCSGIIFTLASAAPVVSYVK